MSNGAPVRHQIVRVKCRECGVEMVGKVRDGFLYATNGPKDPTLQIDGYCLAHVKSVYVPR